MKKRTALTLSLMALLAGGLTFGAWRYKDKKEKEEAERELKEILIPGAENRLDSLLVMDRNLQDSIAHYEQEINKIDSDSLISRSDVEVISKLLSAIEQDLEVASKKWADQYWDLYYEGDGSFSEEGLPQNAVDEVRYLNGGVLKQFDNDTTWTIPGYNVGYGVVDFYDGKGPRGGIYRTWIDRPHYREYEIFAKTEGFDTYVQEIFASLQNSLSEVLPYNAEYDEEYNPNYQLDYFEQEQLLRTLKCFAEKIDNSRNIINPVTLRKLRTVVDSLLIKADMKNLSAKRSNAYNKFAAFRNADNKVKQQLSKQRQLLNKYRSPNAVEMLTQQRTTHK